MPFSGYLKPTDIGELVTAAVDGDLLDIDRVLHLQGISRTLVLGFQISGNKLEQFQLDLDSVNRIERLADGEVPLVQILQNAARQLRLRGRKEAEVFERYSNVIGNQTRGAANLPEPSNLPEVIKQEAIVGEDDMVDFSFLKGGITVGHSVARILVPRFENGQQISAAGGKPWLMVGTAWLIAPQLAITNHHVINARNAEEALASAADFRLQGELASIEFDFDDANSNRMVAAVAEVTSSSKDLDYAILRLQQNPGRSGLRLAGQRVKLNPTTYMAVNIIQHPRGLSKRVAFRNNLVTAADLQFLRYFTDTDFGSSGSPVCDDTWRVVALHRGAKYAQGVKYQGKDAAYVNFGSQIEAVLDDIGQQNSALRTEILDAQPR